MKRLIRFFIEWYYSIFSSGKSMTDELNLDIEQPANTEMQISVFCEMCKEPFNSPIEHIRGRPPFHKTCVERHKAIKGNVKAIPFMRAAATLSEDERFILAMPVQLLCKEFNHIKQKTSTLSANLREVVKLRVEFLIQKGVIKTPDND